MTVNIHPRTLDELREAVRRVSQAGWLLDKRDDVNGNGHVRADDEALIIGVTSPNRGDGKTTLSISLASVLASDLEGEVMLLDADFHTHSIAGEYGLPDVEGFADALVGSVNLPAIAHQVPETELRIVAAGAEIEGGRGRMRTPRAPALLQEMRAMSRYVVADLPATLPTASAPVLASLCDGVLVVVRNGSTTRQDIERTLALLKGSHVLGIVINRWESAIPHWVEKSLGLGR